MTSLRFLLVLIGCLVASEAFAHPHVWVTARSELVYGPEGRMTAVRHAWTFDDMFSSFATQGLDADGDGKLTREELAPLAEVNVTSLAEFKFFTFGKFGDKRVVSIRELVRRCGRSWPIVLRPESSGLPRRFAPTWRESTLSTPRRCPPK